MSSRQLDEIDRGILHLLQQDARDLTPVDIAEDLPVSEGTVRNRIGRLEDDGVIEGYVPTIDYESAGFPLEVVFTCTGPIDRRRDLIEDVLRVHRVVNVREMLSSRENVQVVAIATSLDEVLTVATELTELGLTVDNQRLTLSEHVRPFNHFGEGVTETE